MTDTTTTADVGGRDDAPRSTARSVEPSAERKARSEDGLTVRTITINRPRGEVYAFWRDFANFANVMENVASVTPTGDGVYRWVASGAGDKTLEWDVRVTEDVPDTAIAWQTTEGAAVTSSSRVAFADAQADRGTLVTATTSYDAPGLIGSLIAKFTQQDPAIQQRRDLKRMKMFLETGEIATSSPPNPAPKS